MRITQIILLCLACTSSLLARISIENMSDRSVRIESITMSTYDGLDHTIQIKELNLTIAPHTSWSSPSEQHITQISISMNTIQYDFDIASTANGRIIITQDYQIIPQGSASFASQHSNILEDRQRAVHLL